MQAFFYLYILKEPIMDSRLEVNLQSQSFFVWIILIILATPQTVTGTIYFAYLCKSNLCSWEFGSLFVLFSPLEWKFLKCKNHISTQPKNQTYLLSIWWYSALSEADSKRFQSTSLRLILVSSGLGEMLCRTVAISLRYLPGVWLCLISSKCLLPIISWNPTTW